MSDFLRSENFMKDKVFIELMSTRGRIKRDIKSIVKDSAAIKRATLDEDAAIQDILKHLQTEWKDIIASIQAHGRTWNQVTPKSAKTLLTSLVGRIKKAARNAVLLKRLEDSEARNLRRMAALGEQLSKELLGFVTRLEDGDIKSSVDALQQLRKIILNFDKGLKLVSAKQYRVIDFVKDNAA